MKKMMILTAAFAFLFGMAGVSFGAGQANIVLNGGPMGNVHFPHALHQKVLKGKCMDCHKMFHMEKGIIAKEMASGKLGKKEVMNKLCLACHKARKAKGESAGPTNNCMGCHKR